MAMVDRNTYTAEQRAKAVALYLDHGAAQAAKLLEFDVSPGTIRTWASRAGASRYSPEQTAEALAARMRQIELRRLELRESLIVQAQDMLDRMNEPHVDYKGSGAIPVEWPQAPADACRAYATAAAIMVDKFRLEVGEATSRHEDVSDSDIDREVRRLVEELERNRQSQTAKKALGGDSPPGADTAD